jgi:uncharacterized protein YggU (UPF0235/DUF167 family)
MSGESGVGSQEGPLAQTAEGIRLAAVPVGGAANEALLRFLVDRLSVPRSAVSLVSGQASRSKVVLVYGAKLAQVRTRLGIP